MKTMTSKMGSCRSFVFDLQFLLLIYTYMTLAIFWQLYNLWKNRVKISNVNTYIFFFQFYLFNSVCIKNIYTSTVQHLKPNASSIQLPLDSRASTRAIIHIGFATKMYLSIVRNFIVFFKFEQIHEVWSTRPRLHSAHSDQTYAKSNSNTIQIPGCISKPCASPIS